MTASSTNGVGFRHLTDNARPKKSYKVSEKESPETELYIEPFSGRATRPFLFYQSCNEVFSPFFSITTILKQAPEAGGCATGDGGDREDRGHRADWVNSFKTLSH